MRIERPSFLSSMLIAVMKIFIQTAKRYEKYWANESPEWWYLVLTN
jgi:hypothetical protein